MKTSKRKIKYWGICFLLITLLSSVSFGLNEEELSDKLMADTIENNLPGAMVGVVKDGELTYLQAFGDADDLSNVPFDVKDTAIQVGSLSRVFTSYALVQLLESKNITQETEIVSYLPETLQSKEGFNSLTFYNVLMQTTGLPALKANTALMTSPYSGTFNAFRDEAIAFLSNYNHLPTVTPGTYILPSNVNSILAGLLIEQISGMRYEDYMAQNIFKPLKMFRTSEMIKGKFNSGSHAINYNIFGGVLTPASGFTAKFLPSDDLITTGEDLSQFLLNTSDTMASLFSTKGQNTAGFVGRSIGFSILRYKGLELYLQDGGIPGANARLVFIPEKNFSMFLYYNVDSLKAKDAIMDTVLNHYLSLNDKELYAEPYAHKNLDLFNGVYIPMSASVETVERLTQIIHQIDVKSGTEALMIDDVRYIPLSETVFYNPDTKQIAEFKAGADGKLSHLIMGNQVYKHGTVFKSFFIQALVLGFALFFNLIALLILCLKWSSMKLHRVHDTPRIVLLVHTTLLTLLMTMIFLVSVRYNYWDVIYDRASILAYIKWIGIATGVSIVPAFLVLRRVKEDFRWSASMRFIFNAEWVFAILLILWLVHYQLI